MKNFLLIAVLLAFSSLKAQLVTLVNGNVLVDEKRVCTIKLSGTDSASARGSSDFTVFDTEGQARLKYTGSNCRLLFLDDNKSYIPRGCNAFMNDLAKFLGRDTLFTAKGYNASYKKAFIRKYEGVFFEPGALPATGISDRNRNLPIGFDGESIRQDGVLLGTCVLEAVTSSGQTVLIYNAQKKPLAKVTIAAPEADNTVAIDIITYNEKEKKLKEPKAVSNKKSAFAWLQENGYFDQTITDAIPFASFPSSGDQSSRPLPASSGSAAANPSPPETVKPRTEAPPSSPPATDPAKAPASVAPAEVKTVVAPPPSAPVSQPAVTKTADPVPAESPKTNTGTTTPAVKETKTAPATTASAPEPVKTPPPVVSAKPAVQEPTPSAPVVKDIPKPLPSAPVQSEAAPAAKTPAAEKPAAAPVAAAKPVAEPVVKPAPEAPKPVAPAAKPVAENPVVKTPPPSETKKVAPPPAPEPEPEPLGPITITTYYYIASDKLDAMKAEAVKSSNYSRADEIKKEQIIRKDEQTWITTMETRLAARVKVEDYEGAGKIKERLNPVKENKIRKEQLRKDIAAASAAEDYGKASAKSQELKELLGATAKPAEPASRPVQVNTQSATAPAASNSGNGSSRSATLPARQNEKLNLRYEFSRDGNKVTLRFTPLANGTATDFPADVKYANVEIQKGMSLMAEYKADQELLKNTKGQMTFTIVGGEASGEKWNKFLAKLKTHPPTVIIINYGKDTAGLSEHTWYFDLSEQQARNMAEDLESLGEIK
jgi:hypothetical protein